MPTPVFDPAALIDRLDRFGRALRPLASVVSPEDARWKPDPKSWSVLEIVCHMADEEAGDFRLRTFQTITDPAQAWPGIDPEGWAVERKYNERDLGNELSRFEAERRASVDRLRVLANPSWDNSYRHPMLGNIRAGDLLCAWAEHDALHARQIAKRMHQLTQRDAGKYRTDYAGEW